MHKLRRRSLPRHLPINFLPNLTLEQPMPFDFSSPFKQPLGRWALAVTTVAFLSGCADFAGIVPSAQVLDGKSLGLRPTIATSTNTLDTKIPSQSPWWDAYQDPQLSQLVETALRDNPSLRIAQARLARAQAFGDSTDSAGKPQLNASLDMTRQRFSANGIYPPPLGGNVYDIANLQATASWDLDLFGKQRAALDAAVGQTRAAQADAQAARLLIASQVVRAYFSLGRLQAQNVSLQRSLAQREQLLSLVQERVKAGVDTQLELSVSSASLPEVRQMLEANQEQQALTRNALAALSGQAAAHISSAKLPIASSQTLADTPAIPIDLLGRRADIAASQWRISAALSDVQNAKTQFYPNINLVAFTGLNSLGFDRLMNTGSDQWSVGPAVRLPLFDAGRLKAQLRGKTADLDAAVESYNALVLEAVREVADQIASARGIALQTTQQQAALSHAQTAYAIAQQRYQAGLGNYLNVLNLETAVLTQQRQAIDLAARAADTQVQLIRALGGGYTPEVP